MSAALTRKDRRMMGKRYVVCGAPCSGKTTWVEQHATPGDVVWDFDVVATALTRTERRVPETIPLLGSMRDALIAWLVGTETIADVYLIATQQADAQRIAARIGAEVITMEADEATCLEWLRADPTRAAVADRQERAIHEWFAEGPGE